MQMERGFGALLREARPSWHLYGTYGALALLGLGFILWVETSESGWRWLLVVMRAHRPLEALSAAVAVWGLVGMASLWRNRLRLYERGLYQGPASGRKGAWLAWRDVQTLLVDVLRFPAPLPPLVGHWRILGPDTEILMYPKLYAEAEALAQEISRLSGLPWTELKLSRGPEPAEAHRHASDP